MKLTLIEKRDESTNIKSFFWKSDSLTQWLPGQYLYYTLPNLIIPDNRGTTRQFTISSSPSEKGVIRLTTSIRTNSGFKQTLDKKSIGDNIEAEGPQGSYILDDRLIGKQILIAGGIGITPFRSFIKYNIDNNLKIPVYLIYSNSDDNFVFKSEFENWKRKYDFIKILYYNSGLSGHLNKISITEILLNWHVDINNTNYWIVGPPQFVSAINESLEKIGINDNAIHCEKFTGY
jgi:glycine betaine catabolism B